MALKKKIQTAARTLESRGLRGLTELAARRFGDVLLEPPARDSDHLFDLTPIFRLATCNDLIRLKAKYPQYCFKDRDSSWSGGWSLKQMGALFCIEKLEQIGATKLLEAGAGYSNFFDTHFGRSHEYWMIDDVGFYSDEELDESNQKRPNTRFVKGLLGQFSSELPDGYFDMVFSISALEHVPDEAKSDLYRDMFRVIRPGGYAVHSIDLQSGRLARAELTHLRSAGFMTARHPDLRVRLRRNATLFEPLDQVFLKYGERVDRWTDPQEVHQHYPTVLVVARKPG